MHRCALFHKIHALERVAERRVVLNGPAFSVSLAVLSLEMPGHDSD